jgi:hypothetical protein
MDPGKTTTPGMYLPGVSQERAQPEDGDVLIRLEPKSGGNYSVKQLPGAAQFTAASLHEALQSAREFAKANAVDVWFWDGRAYERLESYRRRGN